MQSLNFINNGVVGVGSGGQGDTKSGLVSPECHFARETTATSDA